MSIGRVVITHTDDHEVECCALFGFVSANDSGLLFWIFKMSFSSTLIIANSKVTISWCRSLFDTWESAKLANQPLLDRIVDHV
jgi:hypothetical protein